MSEQPYKKKLIEVALPLDAINAESAREKSIRHGHPSTLHLWWARRPLAACRAVLFSQLVDDPSAHLDKFPTEEEQDAERERLFELIGKLVKWGNSTNEEVLEAARAEIRNSFGGDPPPILDPFAGGGSIPLEAQRLGLDAYASDLNPVAVLINEALIAIPMRWDGSEPVHPEAEHRTRWQGAEGLAEDVRRYGAWMREQAYERLASNYPKATRADGSTADVIAWIWARVVKCPNPACGVPMPLARSFWLSKKEGRERYLHAQVKDREIKFEVHGPQGEPAPAPKVSPRGASFRCVVCGQVCEEAYVRETLADSADSRIELAKCVQTEAGREFLPGTTGVCTKPVDRSGPELSGNSRHMGGVSYGLRDVTSFYTARQLELMETMVSLAQRLPEQVESDSLSRGRSVLDAERYAKDLTVLLGLTISKMARFHTTLSTWRSDEQKFSRAFGGPAMEMTWDFAEANPFAGSGGDIDGLVAGTADVLDRLQPAAQGIVCQKDARRIGTDERRVICTDPPYYDNIPYSDLADHFYYWLRKVVHLAEPELVATTLTPKSDEIVADAHRAGSRDAAESTFQQGLNDFFVAAKGASAEDAPVCVYYAFKQGEKIRSTEDLLGSTGWSTMLEGLVSAGWQVVATWPLLTEGKTRRRGIGSNALVSSIVLTCRKRSEPAAVIDRQGFVRKLRSGLPKPLRGLQRSHIAPVDLRQAAIGPGMSIFSGFDRVVESDNSRMTVQTALGLINQIVDEVLDSQEHDFDAETRWAIHWFTQFYLENGPYGTAEQLALSMNVAVTGMVESGIVESGGGKVRLLTRDELPHDWDPISDLRTPVWEATQHLVKRLETEGEASAARLLRRMGGLGELAQLLAYRLYTVCERTRPNLAGPYNALVVSWPEIQRLAREDMDPTIDYEQLSLNE
ncbi:MAG: DUF1156 domain-containing protein [Chloroflexota bacterium]|nr:DUF1156 domain-containing protein [Chloroflexota bacterium]